jgi:hypothetical protein
VRREGEGGEGEGEGTGGNKVGGCCHRDHDTVVKKKGRGLTRAEEGREYETDTAMSGVNTCVVTGATIH